jgi:tRNA/rRNA methyltransferase
MAWHADGACDGYTASLRPVELVFKDEFGTRAEVIERERQVKGWSRAKKEALIRGDWEALRVLAKRRPSFDTRAARAAQDERGR